LPQTAEDAFELIESTISFQFQCGSDNGFL
jgi:hypothetical protein